MVAGGAIVAVVGLVAFLVAYGATGGGGGSESVPQADEARSESHGGEPFKGGPRIHFPVESVDLGQIPLQTNVSYAFELTNAGDATLYIEDVQVKMLEGC